jgi:predicted ATPase/DNA-binding XRE family transcriptional regulator
MEQQSFGYWLRLKRKALDLTREELAEQVGYSAATIRKIEDEERHPSAQIVEQLAEIFNIPPNERIDFLRFARGDWKSAPSESIEDSPWRTSTKSTRSNLPATVTSLVGRDKQIADLREYLSNDDIRLVTLMGPPGVGKTRLSLEVAREVLTDFPDGVFFVALAPLSDSTLIASTIAHTLSYVEAKNLSANEQLMNGIRDRQMLLVLDNCEHLIEEISSIVSGLLSAGPRLKILTTSRESLRVPGEWLYPVPTLNVPTFEVPDEGSSIDVETAEKFPVLKLFAERARAVRSDFSLNADNIRIVTTICAQLDGLPLAIELIAARMRLMSPQTVLERLNNQLVLSADGMRAASARQKTLNDAIGWSYKLLSAEEQKLFAYLSVFSGGFTLEAVETMFSQMVTEKPLPSLIALLLDKSLLKLAPRFEASDEARYTMLVTIQEYARERLQEMGEEAEIRNLHLAYFLDVAEKGGKEMRGPNQVEWLHRLVGMRDNLRAALDWAIETQQTEAALQMARKLHWFWFVHSDHTEARRWFERVLAIPDASLYPEYYAEILTQLAHHIGTQTGQTKEATLLVEQAPSIARAHNDKRNIGRALSVLGLNLTDEREFTTIQSILEESKALFLEVHDEWEYAHAVMCLARGAYKHDELALSFTLHEQALALFRKIGDRYFQSFAFYWMGVIKAKQGDVKSGIAALREALILGQQLDSKYAIASALCRLSEVMHLAGDSANTVRLYWVAKNTSISIGSWVEKDESDFENTMASCRAALGEAAFAKAVEQGRPMTIEQAIEYALETSDG